MLVKVQVATVLVTVVLAVMMLLLETVKVLVLPMYQMMAVDNV